MSILKINGLSHMYDNKVLFKDADLTINNGEHVGIVGLNGAGKTTFIKLLCRLYDTDEGEILLDGVNIRDYDYDEYMKLFSVVFQDFRLIGTKTVYENVAFAMRVIGAREKEIRDRVPYVLDLVGLETKAKRHPGELSGGERQRLAIARALVNNPSTIIADEPTGNLDPALSFEIMTLLQEINNLGTTMLVVTHEKSLVEQFNKRVIAIDEGLVVSDGMDGYYHYENQ